MDYRTTYKENLNVKIQLLRDSLAGVIAGDAAVIETVRRLADSLKGSGATYGFPAISTAAAAVKTSPPHQLPEKINELLTVMIAVKDETGSEASQVLIVENDPDIINILSEYLTTHAIGVMIAANLAETETAVATGRVSLILLDIFLNAEDGRTILLRLRENVKAYAIPIIIISGAVDSRIKQECLALGADDYLEKPFDPPVLIATILGKIERATRVSMEARRDNLTGLPNRLAIMETYHKLVMNQPTSRLPLCLAMVDIDDFKLVNDRYGHNVGDLVLKRLAETMDGKLRKTDIAGRWGGEEFILLLPDTSLLDAQEIINRLLETVRKLEFPAADNTVFRITFSSGVQCITDQIPISDSVAQADHYLYVAKQTGKNRVVSLENDVTCGQYRIIHVEDDDIEAAVVEKVLAQVGYEVKRFSSGDELFSAAVVDHAVMILLDINLPGMDGLDILAQLRRENYYRKIPVIMVTGTVNELAIAQCFDLGANDYIRKPFSHTELVTRIQRLIKRDHRHG